MMTVAFLNACAVEPAPRNQILRTLDRETVWQLENRTPVPLGEGQGRSAALALRRGPAGVGAWVP